MKSTVQTLTARRRMAFLAVLLAPALVACGFGAQTDQIYQAAQGVNDRSTNVWILNAAVVAGEDGSGTFAGSFDNQSTSEQSLTNVTGDNVTAGGKGVKVGATDLVNLAEPVAGTDEPQLTLTGSAIKVGGFVRLTFTFSGGAVAVVNVPVVSPDSEDGAEYKDVPLPAVTPTAAETPAE